MIEINKNLTAGGKVGVEQCYADGRATVRSFSSVIVRAVVFALFWFSAAAAAALTVTPNTWNVIGLDSNTPAFGPNRFPVGAKVCGVPADANTYVKAAFNGDLGGTDSGTYIYLRSGSLSDVSLQLDANGCAYAYFEVEVAKTSAAFDKTRRYHLSAEKCTAVVSGSCTATDGSTRVSTPTPRELYVEHLVSQSRNGIDNIILDGVSIPAGGSMNLTVGNTYTIELDGHTAPGGYNQFEEFINIPNTIFQVISVSTTYSTNDSPYVSNPSQALYADSCEWENDPNSPSYLSCVGGDYKTGATVNTTYTVKILSGGGTSQSLGSLLYDFSGSSFHYNADYSTGFRIANIIDPTVVTIGKSFMPATTTPGGVSTLTIALANPNAGLVSGLTFADPFPSGMTVANPTNASTSGCGTPTFSPVAGSGSVSFSNGTVAGNSSCVVSVDVTASALSSSYTNTTNHLFVGAVDTGRSASATLAVSSTPPDPTPASACLNPVTLATWSFDNLANGTGTTTPSNSYQAADVAIATASIVGSSATSTITNAQSSSAPNSWVSTGYTTANTATDATQAYIDIVVDSQNYGGVGISFGAFTASGSWGGTNHLYLYSKTTGAFTNLLTTGSLPTAWTTYSYPAAATGTNTTTFRINAAGSKTSPAPSPLYVDSFNITGCTRPDRNKLQLAKSFAPSTVGVNLVSTLTFTVSNLNSSSTGTLSGVVFTDALPTGLEVAATPNASTTCSGTPTWAPAAGATTLTFGSPTGASVAPGATCTVKVDIKAITAGPHSNVSGFIYSAQTGTNTSSTGAGRATLTALQPPVLSKQFSPNPILTNGVSKITFLITNPNQNDALTGVAFSDTFPTKPGNMVVASSPGAATSGCGAPTFAPVAGAGSISFSNGTIAAGGTCSVTVNVTAPVQSQTATVQSITNDTSLTLTAPYAGSTAASLVVSKNTTSALSGTVSVTNVSAAVTGTGTKFSTELSVGDSIYIGTYRNTTGAVSATTAGNGNTATDALTVSESHPSIALFKEVATTNTVSTLWRYDLVVATGDPIYYLFTAQNFGDVQLTNVTVADADLPAPLAMANCKWFYGYDYTDRIAANLISTPTFTLEVSNAANNHDSATCVLDPVSPVSAASGSHTNNASADGVFNTVHYTDTDWARYTTTGLSLVKSVTETYFTKATDVLHYSYVVTNSGSATLAGPVTVTDNKAAVTCPAMSTVGDLDNYLDPGESITCTASYTVVPADVTAKLVTNTASAATAVSSGVPAATSSTASKTVLLAPDLTATKTNNVGGSVLPGNSFNWTLVVGNMATAGTATFVDGQVLLIDDMPVSGATYTVPAATATNAGLTSGTIDCGLDATFHTTLTCKAIGTVTMPPGGSFSELVTVTTTTTGTLVNPKTGGKCQADPNAVIAEIDETNNDCSNTVTVLGQPLLTIVKSVSPYSDPVHGTAGPKAIPGSEMEYTILVTNTGPGTVDAGTMAITDPIPANTSMVVSDFNGAGSGPVWFTQGTVVSGLTYTFQNLGSATDNLLFSQDGTTYTYTPLPDGNGCDDKVTHVRINPAGVMSAASGGNNPSFTVRFRVRVK